MSAQGIDITTWFYAGKYDLLVTELGRKAWQVSDGAGWDRAVYQVAALAFLGEIDEATALTSIFAKQRPPASFSMRAGFYLGVGEVGRSNYSAAIRLFARNKWLARQLKKTGRLDPVSEFYAAQGSAFFRFFAGQFRLCRRQAESAYALAFASDFAYGQALSLDLLGHALCQLGEIRRGLFEIERALKICQSFDNGGFSTALEISLICYRAQFGLFSASAVTKLTRALESLDAKNSYSKSELYLELARQLVLEGRGSEAQAILERASDTIYKNRSRAQLARFNHRYAHLLLLTGQGHAALTLIRSQKANLDAKMDQVLKRQCEGLEDQILQVQGGAPLRMSHADLGSQPAVNFVDGRIVARCYGGKTLAVNQGEDALGDFIDKVYRDRTQVFAEILQRRWLGLLPEALGLPKGRASIFLGPVRGAMVICSGADVLCIERGVTAPIKKLLFSLSGNSSFKGKEELIREVWGYSYDPLYHDRLLHSTIAKLRRHFGSFAKWIEWSNDGYRLSPEVLLVQDAPAPTLAPRLAELKVPVAEVNHRQLKALRAMGEGLVIGVSEYAKRYRVSKITASRDLSELFRQGKAVRFGRARGTHYGLASN